MFEGTPFDQDISAWNMSGVTNTSVMFNNASAFDQDLSNWDVNNVTNMALMFRNATSFDQSLGSWDVSSVTSMADMLSSSALSTDHYDKTLIDWASLPTIQSNVALGAQGLTYCASEAARNQLISNSGWVISGDVLVVCAEIMVTDSNENEVTAGQTQALDLGNTDEGIDLQSTFTIHNIGDGPLGITEITAEGSGFTLVSEIPEKINSGAVEELMIQLDATIVGDFSGTITIKSNDEDESIFQFPVIGQVDQALGFSTVEIFNIYPNPAKERLSISFRDRSNRPDKISILSPEGRVLSEWENIDVSKTLDLPVGQLREGLYFLSLKKGKTQQVFRFIKR